MHVRATIFLEHPFFSILARNSIIEDGMIRLPFGNARTSPIAAYDVAQVIASILQNPAIHIGKVYELTGSNSLNMNAIAKEYGEALNRPIKYVDVPLDVWRDRDLYHIGLQGYMFKRFVTMAEHAENRYDRLTDDVAIVTGKPSMSIREYVASHSELFKSNLSKV